MSKLIQRLWNGPYTIASYYMVVSFGAALIVGGGLLAEGYFLYSSFDSIPGATHISETFFSGVLCTILTGIVLHRHATKTGDCLTLEFHGRCPFMMILILGLILGAIGTAIVWLVQGTGDIAYGPMMVAKGVQGFFTGLLIPPLFHIMGLLRHPSIVSVGGVANG